MHIQSIQLPANLHALEEHSKQELQQACAVHCNIRAEYAFISMLHQQALKAAESYEKQANEVRDKLQNVTLRVGTCMELALESVEPVPDAEGRTVSSVGGEKRQGEVFVIRSR
jgi:hypothetical protein